MHMTITGAPAIGGEALEALRRTVRGRVRIPLDPDWDAERAAWALAVDQRPAMVVRPADADDVRAAVRYARTHGLRVAVQGTGHNAAPLGDLADCVLVRTDLMREVHVDPATMIARVGAGARWADVVPVAAAHGLAALAGSAPDVGVIGYTLGGGVSWLARSHGLAASSVTAVELVTADGELRRVDDTHQPELFWALRGGGGAFGAVTAIEFRLYALRTVHAGALFWPIERAPDVLAAWREWTDELPASVTSVGRMLRLPPLPELPPELSGRAFVLVEAVFQDPSAVADALLADLRRLAPEIDTFAPTAVADLGALHMDPPGPVPSIGQGAVLGALPPAAVEALLDSGGVRSGHLLSAELRHLGGALAPGRAEGGAVSSIDGEFLFYAVGITPTPESAAAVSDAVDSALAALAPWGAAREYLNFAERPASPARLFGDAHARLRAVKLRVDPADLFRSNHPVR